MADQPFISVITAVYNCEAFLPEAIASVLAQSYPHWEYLLVDDGSTDNTTAIACEVADANPDRIRYLEHPGFANRGACSSRNLALAHARGEYVAILDADDVWLPEKLAEQVTLARQFPQAGVIHGVSEYWRDWTGHPGNDRNTLPAVAPGDRLYTPPELLKLAYPLGPFGAPCPSSLLIAAHLLRQLGGFEEPFDRHQTYEDQALLAKLYLSAPVYVSNRCWDRYRIHSNSCCAVAERTGTIDEDRQLYFEWLRELLIAQKVSDQEIWRAWRRESWRYRHPLLHWLSRAARGVGRRLRRRRGPGEQN